MSDLIAEVDKLREQYRELAAAHSQLLTQQNECTTELTILDDDAKIYKSTGAVLTTQSKADAISTITKRIEYINAEIESKSKLMSSLKSNIEEKSKKLEAISAQMRAAQNN
ncbi:putative prefoldin subunit 6 [Babesia divergens]|uniref:Prefoldin subunit 6 n=1 Tax=Babesia divergens TaxID=32595 RepID=A0AAD9GAM2_BABDI|nr:putative prefoldin subunit 6 [Babesia divergens]